MDDVPLAFAFKIVKRREASIGRRQKPGSESHLRVGVVRTSEIGGVRLCKTLPTALREFFIVVENAARGVHSQMNAPLGADVCQI